MSAFEGPIKEIPGISVDRFDRENIWSSAYFLSHCHTDHMKGLTSEFVMHLQLANKYIYCSPISKAILENQFGHVTNIRDISISEKVLIEYQHENDNRHIYVTCISSGHCPGSVMFLFEKENSDLILYTGDFRINPLDYKKIRPLHSGSGSNKSAKKIAVMYLDTTLLSPMFAHLPTRQEGMNAMCPVVVEWLNESWRNVVVLECSALYGPEYFFMELSKSLNMPVHVKDTVYKVYCRIPDLARHVTNDRFSTRIHACMKKLDRSGLTCRHDVQRKNILTIVASVWKWQGKDTTVIKEWDKDRENTLNVCYSTHASFGELEAFLRYFRPRESWPCVVPIGADNLDDASHIIKHILYDNEANNAKEENTDESISERYTLQISDDEDDQS